MDWPVGGMGHNAETLSALPDDAARLQQVLANLDLVYGGQAAANFEEGLVQDWAKEPYVRGSYSYPSVGSFPDGPNMREVLARSVGGRLFFAGEATHNEAAATVPGALQSGQRAAREIDDALRGPWRGRDRRRTRGSL